MCLKPVGSANDWLLFHQTARMTDKKHVLQRQSVRGKTLGFSPHTSENSFTPESPVAVFRMSSLSSCDNFTSCMD